MTNEYKALTAVVALNVESEPCDEEEVPRLNHLLSISIRHLVLPLGVITLVGFLPAIYVKLSSGFWFLNAWKQGLPATDTVIPSEFIALHAILALLWLCLSLFQVWTGSSDSHFETRRKIHRVFGTLSFVVMVPFLVSAIVLQYWNGLNSSSLSDVLPVLLVLETLGFWIAGIVAVKKKKTSAHKELMAFALTMSYAPGLTRALWYLLQAVLLPNTDILLSVRATNGGVTLAFVVCFVGYSGVLLRNRNISSDFHLISRAVILVVIFLNFLYSFVETVINW